VPGEARLSARATAVERGSPTREDCRASGESGEREVSADPQSWRGKRGGYEDVRGSQGSTAAEAFEVVDEISRGAKPQSEDDESMQRL